MDQAPSGLPPPTQTKTKINTKTIVGAVALMVSIGLVFAVVALRGSRTVCNSGSRVGEQCRSHTFCQQTPADRSARCVVPSREVPRTSPGGAPDLHVFPVIREPDTPIVGERFILRAGVQNLGTAIARESVFSLQLDLGNDGVVDETLPSRSIPSIAARGSSAEVSWEWSAWPAGGVHRLVLCADSEGMVRESDEGNNCSTAVIVANPATEDGRGLLITASLSPSSPSGATPQTADVEVLRFNVSADATGGSGSLRAIAFALNSTDNNTLGWNTWQASNEAFIGLQPADFRVYDTADTSTPLAGTWRLFAGGASGELLNDDAETARVVDFAQIDFTTPVSMTAGVSRAFLVRMDVTGISSSLNDTLRLDVVGIDSTGAVTGGLPVIGGTLTY